MKHFIFTLFLCCASSCFGQLDSIKKVEIPVGKDYNTYFAIADSNYALYRLPSGWAKTENWKKMDKKRSGYTGYFSKNYQDSMNLEIALSFIDSAKEVHQVCDAISWCIYNYEEAFPYLVARLSNKTKVGLRNTADLIIWGRIDTGDLRFYGHGGVIEQDIFTVAGRAAEALNQLTGEDFAQVRPDLTEKQAQQFKEMWLEYLKKL